jgi:hypothetical protein
VVGARRIVRPTLAGRRGVLVSAYDEEREDYAALADEVNDGDAGPWVESDWDARAVASAKRYAARMELPWPPGMGDFDRWYEKHARDA